MPSSNRPEPTTSELDDLRRLVQQAPCGLISMAPDGTIQVVNDGFVSLSGRPRAELLDGVRFRDLLSGGGRVFYETHVAPMLHMQGFAREIALDVVRPDGTRLQVLINAVLHRDGDGRPTHAQMVVLDATERRGYEHDLLVSTRRVARLQRITARFASTLEAHEVAAGALDEIVDGIKADCGVVALLASDTTDTLTALGLRSDAAEVGAAWEALRVEPPQHLATALASGTAAFIEGGDGRAEGIPSLTAPAARCTRVAVLPLVVDDRSIGVLCLGSSTLAQFEPDERTFLVSFSRACAQALDRARLQHLAAISARRLEFLASLSRTLDEAVSFPDRAQIVVDLLVPEFADFASIEVAERGHRPVAARHVDPDLLDTLLELRTNAGLEADSPHSLARARATLEPQLLSEVPEALYSTYGLDDEQLSLLRRLAPRSYVGLPLLARDRLVGSLLLVMSDSPRRFGRDDLGFLVDVAERVAISLENARLHEHEQGLALRLQLSLLPSALPSDRRLRFSAFYRPNSAAMEIGGDWYDAFFIDEQRIGFAVGDVVGHNEDAALTMGQMSTALRAYALEGNGPSPTLGRLSRFVTTLPAALCTTVAYAELDISTRVLTYACAGHPPPILQEPGQPARALWNGRSPVLGIAAHVVPDEAALVVSEGSTVLLFTDGLIERRGVGVDAGIAALLAHLDALPPLATAPSLDAIVTAVLDPAAPPTDDLCAFTVSLVATDEGG